jgi:hypothetical protein
MKALFLIIPIVSTILFCLVRVSENYFLENDNKYDVRIILRDAIIVFLVSVTSMYIDNFCLVYVEKSINMLTNAKMVPIIGAPEIFTDAPNF